MFSLSFIMGILVLSPKGFSQIGVDVSITANVAPPELPVYVQPECPEDGYLWTPGYWAYGDDGYYWVPGVWVSPPQPGYLWTPCYWGFVGGVYSWNRGYWGEHVGFYGGVNYGYGYGGSGFGGGRWDEGHFRYNTAVVNVNTTVIHNTYIDRSVVNNTTVNNHTSFNGGARGTHARPSAREQSVMKESHISPTSNQASHEQTARQDKGQYASANHGRPATTAMNTVGGSKFGQKGHASNPASVTRQQSRPVHIQATSPNHAQGTNNATHPKGHAPTASPATHQLTPTTQHNNENMNGGFHEQPQQHAPAQQHISMPQKHTQAPQQAAPTQQQHTSMPQQHTQAPQQHTQAPQQHTQAPQQHTQAPQQHAPAQHQAPNANGGGEREHH